MPKTKEQYEEMRLKSKNTIIEAALNQFAANGYHATTISAIAKEAGLALGLMYHYFKSKEDLLIYIMEDHLQQIQTATLEQMGKTIYAADARVLIDTLFQVISQRSDSWKLIISVMFQPDVSSRAKQLIEGLLIHQQDMYTAYFNRIGAKHPLESSRTLTAVLHGTLINFAMSGNTEDFQLIRANVIEKLLISGV